MALLTYRYCWTKWLSAEINLHRGWSTILCWCCDGINSAVTNQIKQFHTSCILLYWRVMVAQSRPTTRLIRSCCDGRCAVGFIANGGKAMGRSGGFWTTVVYEWCLGPLVAVWWYHKNWKCNIQLTQNAVKFWDCNSNLETVCGQRSQTLTSHQTLPQTPIPKPVALPLTAEINVLAITLLKVVDYLLLKWWFMFLRQ